MDIKQIIRKTTLEVDEICYVIQEYIKDRKGVDVKVSPKLMIYRVLTFLRKDINGKR